MPGRIDELTHTTTLGTWRLTRAQPCTELAGIVHEYEISDGKSKELWSMVMHRSSPPR